ncbi:MAG: YfbM family protein [Micromonospora sp.]
MSGDPHRRMIMGSLGVHFAIDEDMAARLLTAEDDEVVMALIEEVEEETAGVDHCDTDKAWDAIHRSLTDGLLGYDNGDYPLNAVILGGRQLYEGEEYIVSLLTPEQVCDAANVLTVVSRERLRAGYEAIDVADYGPEFGDEDFEYTWENFTGVIAFFERAAQSGRHVVFTVDQ